MTGRNRDWWWPSWHKVDRKMPRSFETSRFWGNRKLLSLSSIFQDLLCDSTSDNLYLFFPKVIWEKDLAVGSPVPWYLPLDKSHFSLSSFRLTAVGRLITKNMVRGLWFKCCLGVLEPPPPQLSRSLSLSFLFSESVSKNQAFGCGMVLRYWGFQGSALMWLWKGSWLELIFPFLQVKALEFVGVAPKGSQRVQNFLEQAAEGLVEGGK